MTTDRWPDLGVLELLVAVAETGSLGAAAARVGTTQPSASRSLARLERRLGVSLLERSPRGTRLTAEGTLVVDWSRDVLATADRWSLSVAALKERRTGELRIAASMTVAEYLVPSWLSTFRRAEPEVDVQLGVGNSEFVLDALERGEIDLGFVETTAVRPAVRSRVVAHDRLVVVTEPGHAWARRRAPLPLAELAATRLVLREPGSGTRLTLETAVVTAGLDLVSPRQELVGNAAVRISAASGAGPAVLSEYAVEDAVAAGDLVRIPLEHDPLRRDLRAVWTGGARPVGPAGALLAVAAAAGTLP